MNWWKRFLGSFDPTQGWSKGHKVLTYVVIIVLLVLLVCSLTVFKSERIVEKVVEVQAKVSTPTPTPTSTSTPTPTPIIWPKTDLIITGNATRTLLTNTFTNRRMTAAYFNEAALYTVDQFKEIRAKMTPLVDNHLPWSSLIDKVIGTFQEPGIEDLPIGWANPTNESVYLIVVLQDAGRPKIFGFDPLDSSKLWEVTIDTRVESAIVR
ncbi:MAG: hypothetical protein ABH841_03070 [Candidatus Nealsonbacteria bacterium]